MRGGQADDEASGIYGEATQDHNEVLNPLAGKFEALLQDLIQAKNRQENAGQTSTLGKLKVSKPARFYAFFKHFVLVNDRKV